MIVKFSASEPERAYKAIAAYLKPGNAYVVEIQRAKQKRSLSQNRYYFGVIVSLVSQSTGYSKEEMHQELTKMFLGYERNGKYFVRSTKDLDKGEAEKYFDKCRHWAMEELNIHIPLPNEITEEMYMQLKNIYQY